MPVITFETIYHTVWGQSVVVVGNRPELGDGDPGKGFALEYADNGLWSGKLSLSSTSLELQYHYAVIDKQGILVDREWGNERSLPLAKSGQIQLREGWRARQHPENAFYNSAFLHVIFKPGNFVESELPPVIGSKLRFEIAVPRTFQSLQICILGNIEALGNWNYEKPLLLNNSRFPHWEVTIPMPRRALVQYKYGFYDPRLKKVLYLEDGPNRHFSTFGTQDQDLFAVRDVYFRHRVDNWKGSGVAIPVFSLRSQKSFGVGAFTDLRILIDWARQTGMRLVQILPINDTSATNSWLDSYPYSSISVFALHPQYLDLTALDGFEAAVDQKEYAKNQKELNALPVIDYEKVIQLKLRYARQVFETQKKRFVRTKAFRDFSQNNEHWLKPYALFCLLRDLNNTPDFSLWKDYQEYSPELVEKFNTPKSEHYNEILFYYYLQFNLDQQLFSVSEYARSQGIILKGDIAIGIFRNSADAWTMPDKFDMRSQAGAPPDPFSDLGQNWGFPTYRWDVMAKNGYAWWRSRLQNLSRYFDAFRIDHILGFFRIWQIPYRQIQGILGYFNPALPVTPEELEQRGIPFDKERFCEPYITDQNLEKLFGDEASLIIDQFLEQQEHGRYSFKEAFADQRKVYDYFRKNPESKEWQPRIFQLHAEVLFLLDLNAEEEVYHPRIDFQKTESYHALHPSIQNVLEALYIDYFYRRQEDFWREQGMTKLPAIKSATDMLICGEDLGMIPACVPEVMKELDLLTLEIQRMSKNPKTEFLREADIPYLSVCSTSTHDMSPIRAWWEESKDDYVARFYHQILHLQGIPPKECTSFIAEQIIFQHLNWPEMWAIFPLQDLLALSDELKRKNAMDERINIPANPNHYWQYRMHIYLEELLSARTFNEKLQNLFQRSGRAY